MTTSKKTKIVLDADVIIHFAKGGLLHLLPNILPEFQFVVLDIVKSEIIARHTLIQLENQIALLKNIQEETFGDTPDQIREYARLTSSSGLALGRGESACMVYCRFHNDVVGSSNMKDIAAYCDEYGITYLTTNDFLYYGIQRKVFTKKEAYEFVEAVIRQGSKLKIVNFDAYICTKI